MIDIQQLTSLISAFRVETEKESISPETVGSCFPRSLISEKLGTENQRFSSLDLQNGVSRAIFAHVFAQKKEQIREFEHSGGREQSLWL